ncbi:MAG: class I SAM-dependent methyltransferase [Chloroflexi bacterium]|nr:class I SAM-dependent methyltransferase [Chloroflexota bacterium]
MTNDTKQKVREFYDQVGWMQEEDGLYQNARYEDLRPVTAEYIHKCHLRVKRHIAPSGGLLLDAGSGPVQYPEYVTYSENYKHRVCADISITALREARQRLGERGLYVVADIANLPFRSDAFDAIVSLHTIHHLPLPDHKRAYAGLFRVLKPSRSAVVVNGWDYPSLMKIASFFIRPVRVVKSLLTRGQLPSFSKKERENSIEENTGTYIEKIDVNWLRRELSGITPIQIYVWRSLSTRFTRTLIYKWLGGFYLLRFVYWLEEKFPRFFGENGQYPMIVFRKEN